MWQVKLADFALALDPDQASPVLAWPLEATKPIACFFFFKSLSFWEWDSISLCSPRWPATLSVDQAGLELPEILPNAGIAGVHHRT